MRSRRTLASVAVTALAVWSASCAALGSNYERPEIAPPPAYRFTAAPDQAEPIAEKLSSGVWTHDYPITVGEARALGLPIDTNMPREVYQLMNLYPQSGQRRPSVDYIPMPYPLTPPAPRRERGGEPRD